MISPVQVRREIINYLKSLPLYSICKIGYVEDGNDTETVGRTAKRVSLIINLEEAIYDILNENHLQQNLNSMCCIQTKGVFNFRVTMYVYTVKQPCDAEDILNQVYESLHGLILFEDEQPVIVKSVKFKERENKSEAWVYEIKFSWSQLGCLEVKNVTI